MVSESRTESEKKQYERARDLFNNHPLISDNNKEFVNTYIKNARKNKKDRNRKGWMHYRTSYNIMKLICLKIFPNRDLMTLTQEDISDLSDKLEEDLIKKNNGNNYSTTYKAKISKHLIDSFKFNNPKERQKYDDLFINDFGKKILNTTYEKRKDKKILSYEQVHKLVENKNLDIRWAFWFSIMFDGGFRPIELFEAKVSDLVFQDEDDKKKYIFHVRESKNGKPRTVSLVMFPDIISSYLELLKKNSNFSENMKLFDYSEQYLNRVTKNCLRDYLELENYKDFSSYSLRRSSATYYALHVAKNPMKIYARFGWIEGSSEASEYIQLSTANLDEDDEVIREVNSSLNTKRLENEFKELKKENQELHQNYQYLASQIELLKETYIPDKHVKLKEFIDVHEQLKYTPFNGLNLLDIYLIKDNRDLIKYIDNLPNYFPQFCFFVPKTSFSFVFKSHTDILSFVNKPKKYLKEFIYKQPDYFIDVVPLNPNIDKIKFLQECKEYYYKTDYYKRTQKILSDTLEFEEVEFEDE
ncbi:MAG: tyrosine-type recombinase/integrase [Candidatus Nanoarchaeia archaeon]